MAQEKLIVFLKAPRAGQVKTRLAETVGDTAACAAYKELLQTVLCKIRPLSLVELRFAPADAAREIQGLLQPGWTMKPQGEGDLGARMHRAFDESFSSGASRVVIIGSDCPYLECTDIEAALMALRETDLVIGPATDGGYWLIGLCNPQPLLFEKINWSTGAVLRQTLDCAKRNGLSFRLLRELSDVDAVLDWNNFLNSKLD